jgi:hypothetical protein
MVEGKNEGMTGQQAIIATNWVPIRVPLRKQGVTGNQ